MAQRFRHGQHLRPQLHKLTRSTRSKLKLPEKHVLPFYRSQEWRELTAALVACYGRICRDPNHAPGMPRNVSRIYCDHIVELKDGGSALDPRNVRLICAACHTAKTVAKRKSRYSAPQLGKKPMGQLPVSR